MTETDLTPLDAQPARPKTAHLLDVRACAGCGYDLCGQPYHRDERTGLHLVTCPACGERAALEVYPAAPPMGPFVRPFVAVLWLIVCLGLVCTTVSMLGITSFEMSRWLVNETGGKIEDAITAGMIEERIAKETAESDRPLRVEYVSRVGGRAVLDRMGPWTTWFPWWTLFGWIPAMSGFVLAGVVWSLILWGQPLHRRIMVMVVMTFFGWVLFLTWLPSYDRAMVAYFYSASLTVNAIVMWWTFPFATICYGGSMVVGVVIGRALARWYVQVLLPPPLRVKLRSLWMHDARHLPALTPPATRAMESP